MLNIFNILGLGIFSFSRFTRRKKNIIIVIGFFCSFSLIVFIVSIADYYINYLNLREDLSATIAEENIVYGKINAYHPETLYKKYRLAFATKHPVIEEHIPNNGHKSYFFIKNIDKITQSDLIILKQDDVLNERLFSPVGSYVKFTDTNKTYLLTISSSGGSANFNISTVRLYREDNNHYVLVLNRSETYSTDPGIDSHFFIEHLDMWLLKNMAKDDRYRK